MSRIKRVYLDTNQIGVNHANVTYSLNDAELSIEANEEMSVALVEAVLPATVSWLASSNDKAVLSVATGQSGYIPSYLYITDDYTYLPSEYAYTGLPTDIYVALSQMQSVQQLIDIMNEMLYSTLAGGVASATARFGVDHASGKLISEDSSGPADQILIEMKYGNVQGASFGLDPEPAFSRTGQLIQQALGLNCVDNTTPYTALSGYEANQTNRAIWLPVNTPRLCTYVMAGFSTDSATSLGEGKANILEAILPIATPNRVSTSYQNETVGTETEQVVTQFRGSNVVYTKKHIDRVRIGASHLSEINISLQDSYGNQLYSSAPCMYELEFEFHTVA